MKRGPKPQPEAHRATELILARVTPAEKRVVREMARRYERGRVSDLIKAAIEAYRPKTL